MTAQLQHKPANANSKDSAQSHLNVSEPLGPLQSLIMLENEALNASDRLSVKHQAVNNPRRILDVGHIFWISRRGKTIKISALSSQSDVDKNSPFIQDICHVLKDYAKSGQLDNAGTLNLSEDNDLTAKDRPSGTVDRPFEYTFPHGFFAPFAPYPKTGGLLFTRGNPFAPAQEVIMNRLAQSYGAIWTAMSAKPRDVISKRRKLILSGAGLLALLIGLVPVPIATLAPAEIVADEPFIIAAPVDGVIDNIHVAPNSAVKAGAVLAQMVDTEFKSQLHVAAREEHVSQARLRQASLSSFIDEAAKRELAVAKAETTLARARTQYAQNKLSCLLYTSPSPRDQRGSRMPSSA